MRSPMRWVAAFAVVAATRAFAADVPPPFAGVWGTLGSGPAQFDHPFGIASDRSTLFVADQQNNRIQKFAPDGSLLGEWPVPGASGEPAHPTGIDVSRTGIVYVVAHHVHRVHMYSADGDFLGSFGGPAPMPGGADPGTFSYPVAVATGPDGAVYVTDSENHRVQKFTATGAFLQAWGSIGSGPGEMVRPYGIVVSAAGRVYVSDAGNNRIQAFDAQGQALGAWGGYGAGAGQFRFPEGLVLDGAGNLYVCDTGNDRIQKFSSTGAFLTAWGSRGQRSNQFYTPSDIAADAAGNLYVAEWNNHRIQKFGVAVNRPPDCSRAMAVTPIIWPPDHRMIPVAIAGVTDPEGDPVSLFVTAVTQDEAVTDAGTGPHCPDAIIEPDGAAQVRAERMATGPHANGRLYRLHFTASDGRGGVSRGRVDVGVPHDRSSAIIVDDGQDVDALGPCPQGPDRSGELEIREVRRADGVARVTFALPADADVSLAVFDIAGRRISGLSEGRRPAGVGTATWNLAGLPRGVYFIRLLAGGAVRTRSILIR